MIGDGGSTETINTVTKIIKDVLYVYDCIGSSVNFISTIFNITYDVNGPVSLSGITTQISLNNPESFSLPNTFAPEIV